MPVALEKILRQALHLVYPNTCLCCHKLLEAYERDVCSECFAGFDRFMEPGEAQMFLMSTLEKNFPGESDIDRAISCYKFHKKSHLAHAIHAIKYEGFQKLAVDFGKLIGQKLRSRWPHLPFEIIVPIPLHPIKKIERTYNQAELLAQGISQECKLRLNKSVLERARHTVSQTTFHAMERKENLRDVFFAKQKVEHSDILLVDDVFTTGATVLSAAKVLKNAGAKSVTVATLAVADS